MNNFLLLFSIIICIQISKSMSLVADDDQSIENGDSVLSTEDLTSAEYRKKGSGGSSSRPIRPGGSGGGGGRRRRRRNAPVLPLVFCYYGSWSNYRPGAGRFGVGDLPYDLCTHIAYSFIAPNAEGDLILPEETVIQGKSNKIEDFLKLKERNSAVKLLVAVGGWEAGSQNFSIVSNNDFLRGRFVQNVVKYLDEKGFDGLDVDWEYPAQNGGSGSDKEAFIRLLRDLKEAFAPKNYLLTAAVAPTQNAIDLSYNVPAMSEILDLINLMTYDYHGVWSDVTGAVAPLYPQLTDEAEFDLNVNQSVQTWIENGAPPEKLVLGLAAYGRSFTLANSSYNDTGAPFEGAGLPGPYTLESGLLSYHEICVDQLNNNDEWSVTTINDSYVYSVKGDQWVGHENNITIFAKGEFARIRRLVGVMIWAVDFDDFNDGCRQGRYPTIREAIEGFKNNANGLYKTSLISMIFLNLLIYFV